VIQSNDLLESDVLAETRMRGNSDGVVPSTAIEASQLLDSHQIKATYGNVRTWNLIPSDTVLSSFLFLQTISFRVTEEVPESQTIN
jgi:hypothetical protein